MLKHYISAYKDGDDRPPLDLTGFGEEFEDFCRCFDADDYLNRHPEIQQIIKEGQKPTRKLARKTKHGH